MVVSSTVVVVVSSTVVVVVSSTVVVVVSSTVVVVVSSTVVVVVDVKTQSRICDIAFCSPLLKEWVPLPYEASCAGLLPDLTEMSTVCPSVRPVIVKLTVWGSPGVLVHEFTVIVTPRTVFGPVTPT